MHVVGLILLILILLAGIGSNLPEFADPPSLIIVLGFSISALLIARVRLGAMVRGALSSGAVEEDVAEAARGWELARRAAVAGGAVGVVVGMVIMLSRIEPDAPLETYMRGSAILILTLLYGWILGYGVFLPLESFARSRQG